MVPHLHDPASNKYVRLSFWPCFKCFLSLKSPKIFKSSWEDWKTVTCHWNQIFYSDKCVLLSVYILGSFYTPYIHIFIVLTFMIHLTMNEVQLKCLVLRFLICFFFFISVF